MSTRMNISTTANSPVALYTSVHKLVTVQCSLALETVGLLSTDKVAGAGTHKPS